MKNKSSPFLLVTALMLSVSFFVTKSVQAEIFKCEDVEGKVFYNDKPCPLKNKETKMKSVKDPVNGYVPAPLEFLTEGEQNQKAMNKNSALAGSVDTEKNPEEVPQSGQTNKNSVGSEISNTSNMGNTTKKSSNLNNSSAVLDGSSVSDAAKADTSTDYSSRKYTY